MTLIRRLAASVVVLLLVLGSGNHAEAKRFSELVGKVTVAPVKDSTTLKVPYITWGGDMATFYANGGTETKAGSIFANQGLSLKLSAGDDFVQQVRDYISGKSPFLRGTFRMMGMASEVIGADPRTQGVVIMQMTWSAGDHAVAKSSLRTLSDLKGKTIVLQQGGPHVGMLDDMLKSADLDWKDVKVEWAKDLTGTPNSPAEMFRTRSDIDLAFVITPDMIGLTGGHESVGTGAEGTVKGARILVSTAELSRSIADVYVVRKDFYEANKEKVTKFVAAYLKGVEELVGLKTAYEAGGSPKYQSLLKLTQQIYGNQTIPNLDEAHGLLSDCSFVGHQGNVVFFTKSQNFNGFAAFEKSALDLAQQLGYANERRDLLPAPFDWSSATFTGYLTKTGGSSGERFNPEATLEEIEKLSAGGALDADTIYSFTISFSPNQQEFSVKHYAGEFRKVVKLASKYGGAAVAIRGHSDPTKTLLTLVKAGMQRGVLKRSGASGNYKYFLNGRPLDLQSMTTVQRAIEGGAFDGATGQNPRLVMQNALNLSRRRAQAVRSALISYAKSKGFPLDESQVLPVGVGIREPLIPKPKNLEEAKTNMRVEFRLVRVSPEAMNKSEFDF